MSVSVDRICFSCLTPSPPGVDVCACGHPLEEHKDETSKTVEVARQHHEEGQYEEYYRLRLQQAQAALRDLIAAYGRSGWTAAQRGEIESAILRVDQAKQDLSAQQQRADIIRKHLEDRRRSIEIRLLDGELRKRW